MRVFVLENNVFILFFIPESLENNVLFFFWFFMLDSACFILEMNFANFVKLTSQILLS